MAANAEVANGSVVKEKVALAADGEKDLRQQMEDEATLYLKRFDLVNLLNIITASLVYTHPGKLVG